MEPLWSKQDVIIDNDELLVNETGTKTVHSEGDDRDLIKHFQSDEQSNKECFVKILGINWNVETDEFKYDLSELENYAATLHWMKRSVL